MTDSIYLVDGETVTEVSRDSYKQESDLQRLIDRHPELVPGAQINPESPRRWLLVRSEAGVPNEEGGTGWWAIDHLLMDQDGVPTFVEVKRSTDTRIRREVVAQMLEYAANGTAYWRMEELRAWFEETQSRSGHDPEEVLRGFLGEDGLGLEEFWPRVEENLQAARVRCLFVADSIPPTLRRLVEFLNEHLDTVEVLAVELPRYVHQASGLQAVVPRLVGQTEKARAQKRAPTQQKRQWDEGSFMADIRGRYGDGEIESLAHELLQWCAMHADRVAWGHGKSYGSATVRVRGADGEQVPLTLWSDGSVELDFEYLKYHEPFADEQLRKAVWDRINAVEGISLKPGSWDLRPSIPCKTLLRLETREGVLSIMEEVMVRIREGASPVQGGGK